jgi:hypothetical protein
MGGMGMGGMGAMGMGGMGAMGGGAPVAGTPFDPAAMSKFFSQMGWVRPQLSHSRLSP